MSKFFAVVLVFAVVASANAFVPKITSCATPGALLSDLKYSWSPNDVTPGTALTVNISGTLGASIADAQLTANVKFDGIPLINKKEDACKLKAGICPFPAGAFFKTFTFTVPQIPIHGAVDAKITLYSEPSGDEITCLDATATI